MNVFMTSLQRCAQYFDLTHHSAGYVCPFPHDLHTTNMCKEDYGFRSVSERLCVGLN